MNLTFTDAAIRHLEDKVDALQLSLFYDDGTDVCACANSGVFILRANDTPDVYDATIDSNFGLINIQTSALIYLDQANIIDFNSQSNAFVLKSERGYLNLNLRLEITSPETV